MAILHFPSAKSAARAVARVRWYSELDAKQGKVLFVPPSEHVVLQFERFVCKEVESKDLTDVLTDESYGQFSEWQLYDAHKLYEDEPGLPPWPFREVYFFASSDVVETAHEAFSKFKIENLRLDTAKGESKDLLRYRLYVDRRQVSALEDALRVAQVSGHCKESPLYKCRDPDGPSK